MSGLKPGLNVKSIYSLEGVNLTKYSGIYDKNNDSIKESLIVYVQPIDNTGDVVKAAGTVDVQLWNLNTGDKNALLGEWHIGPQELKKLWFSTLLSTNYRLIFNVGDKIKGLTEPLTVKVTFTDYLTGQKFEQQKAVNP